MKVFGRWAAAGGQRAADWAWQVCGLGLLLALAALPMAVTAGEHPDPDSGLPEPSRVIQAGPEDYREAVARLQPGDWLQLAPGEYPRPLSLRRLQGTAEAPIVVSGPAEGDPAVLLGRPGANTVSLLDSAHIVVRHLTLDGQRHPIAGVVAEAHGNYAHDITLEHLRIRNYDRGQGNTGITNRVPAWNWVIRHNDIRDVGTGLYLGQSDGDAPFINGLIEHNHVARTRGYNMQIKHQNPRDTLPDMPVDPKETVIRYNVFDKSEGGSSGGRARPNLLLGHWPLEGPGSEDRYRVYGNLFYQNPHERLFQGEGHVALYSNLFVNRHGDGLILMPHNDVPKEVLILDNTVMAAGFGIRLDRPDGNYTQQVAGNAVFAAQPLRLPDGLASADDNHTESLERAGEYLVAPLAGLDELDLYPRDGALGRDEATQPAASGLPDVSLDFNARERTTDRWGAYGTDQPFNPGRRAGVGPALPDCAPCR